MTPSLTDKPRYAVLYVDDEVKALHYFREAFEDDFPIYTANNAADGYAILMERGAEIGVLMSDQRMPGESGVELLEKARRLNPNLVRILVTAYTDYQTAVDAVNDGRVYRYIHKPWEPETLQGVLERALDLYKALIERDKLLGEKAETMRNMMMADKVAGLEILAEGLNHHLRNALTVIRAFIDLAPLKLDDELNGSPPQDPAFWTELHGQAQDQVQRIQIVLGRLGDASQARDLPCDDQLDVMLLLDQVASTSAHAFTQRGVQFSHYVHPTVPPIRVNGDRFRSLWRMLVADQLTHLGKGDTVHVHAEPSTDVAGRPCVTFIIEDTGAWVSEENVSNLFDPFFVRTHQPAELGVNLTACYVIVHQHGGSINAMPKEGGGLRIQMVIPIDGTRSSVEPENFFDRMVDHERRWLDRES
jgi:two-component system probable response regulator PhcQ